MNLVMTTMSVEDMRQLFRDVLREEKQKDSESVDNLISYREITEVYNVGKGTISTKVNGASLEIQKTHYKGRLQNAITRKEAERLFRKH